MATYSTIKGFQGETLAADPSNLGAGQVWYNTTTSTLKGYGQQGTAAWASGGAINTGRKYVGSGGLTTAAWIGAGNAPSAVSLTIAETYDGTSWTEVNDLNTGRSYMMGSGSSTAALAFGGWYAPNPPGTAVSALTESYNATSWTEVADLNTARRKATGQGTNTAALLAGGSINSLPAGAGDQKTVEIWDGTSWTEVSDLNTARMDISSATQGTPTAALVFGGSPQPAANQLTESYNGTSWTEVADLTTPKTIASGAGVQGFALCWGGINPPFYSCEQWNGTSWTEVADIGISQYGTGHGGTATTAWQAAGSTSPGSTFPTAVEEFSTPLATKTFTAS